MKPGTPRPHFEEYTVTVRTTSDREQVLAELRRALEHIFFDVTVS